MPFLTPLSANTLERSPGRRTAPGKSPLKPAKSPLKPAKSQLKPAKSQLKPAESLKAAQPEEVRVFGVGGVLQEVRGAAPAANRGEGRAARAPPTDPEEGCAEWTAEAWAEWEGEWSAEEWSEWEGQWTARGMGGVGRGVGGMGVGHRERRASRRGRGFHLCNGFEDLESGRQPRPS